MLLSSEKLARPNVSNQRNEVAPISPRPGPLLVQSAGSVSSRTRQAEPGCWYQQAARARTRFVYGVLRRAILRTQRAVGDISTQDYLMDTQTGASVSAILPGPAQLRLRTRRASEVVGLGWRFQNSAVNATARWSSQLLFLSCHWTSHHGVVMPDVQDALNGRF